jgi:hypothetical protein
MKPGLSLVSLPLLLSFAVPAFAQSHVYTNADLDKPLSAHRPVPTTETIEGLAAHQFALPDHYDGPHVVGVFSSPTAGPFGEFWPQIREPWVDGSSFFYPPLSYPPFGYPAFGYPALAPGARFSRGLAPRTANSLRAHHSAGAHRGVQQQPHHRTR